VYVPVEPSLVGCVCGWEERCDTVDSKLDPDREDSKQPFPLLHRCLCWSVTP